jgi:hypothetical protein
VGTRNPAAQPDIAIVGPGIDDVCADNSIVQTDIANAGSDIVVVGPDIGNVWGDNSIFRPETLLPRVKNLFPGRTSR